jgi:hypothetical protein
MSFKKQNVEPCKTLSRDVRVVLQTITFFWCIHMALGNEKQESGWLMEQKIPLNHRSRAFIKITIATIELFITTHVNRYAFKKIPVVF